MKVNFNNFYGLFRLVFDPLTNLLKSITINGTALLVILVTLFMLLMLLRFLLRLQVGGITGMSRQADRSTKKGR